MVFPELSLTTFFPRWYHLDINETNCFFETAMPGPITKCLFQKAAELGIGFYLGYAELTPEGKRFNSSVLVDDTGRIVGKYRKIHLPGHAEFAPERRWQHLERRYFETGDLGFPVWRTMDGNIGMCICYDRFWPETYRVMGLQDAELILVGYNTPAGNAFREESPELRLFQNHLCLQAGAHQNSCWVIASAKAGNEDGHLMMGGSTIVAPSGEIVARATTLDDELVIADCDLNACQFKKQTTFNFAKYREPDQYRLIIERRGSIPPS